MSTYYLENHLRPNPGKTQICSFHLKNREAKRELNVTWDGIRLENHQHPVYLGVILDRTLSYKEHIQKTRAKVSTRNSLLRQLTNSKWGAHPSTLRTTALALCFSTAEYACPAWYKSSHAYKIDPILNETCRIMTGCIKTTPIPCLYALSGIAPLISAGQSPQKPSAQSKPTTTGTHFMNTLPPRNDSSPGAASWTPLLNWRPHHLLPGSLSGTSSGAAWAARQPAGQREASPQTNVSLPAMTNLGLSGKP